MPPQVKIENYPKTSDDYESLNKKTENETVIKPKREPEDC